MRIFTESAIIVVCINNLCASHARTRNVPFLPIVRLCHATFMEGELLTGETLGILHNILILASMIGARSGLCRDTFGLGETKNLDDGWAYHIAQGVICHNGLTLTSKCKVISHTTVQHITNLDLQGR